MKAPPVSFAVKGSMEVFVFERIFQPRRIRYSATAARSAAAVYALERFRKS